MTDVQNQRKRPSGSLIEARSFEKPTRLKKESMGVFRGTALFGSALWRDLIKP
jgi:hypothetical protein